MPANTQSSTRRCALPPDCDMQMMPVEVGSSAMAMFENTQLETTDELCSITTAQALRVHASNVEFSTQKLPQTAPPCETELSPCEPQSLKLQPVMIG